MKGRKGLSSGEPDTHVPSADTSTSKGRSSSARGVGERSSGTPAPRRQRPLAPTTKNTKGKGVKKNPLGGGSLIGWHYVLDARLCLWRFYLKNIIGLRPTFYARALLFGQAFHAGKAHFYTEGSKGKTRSNAALVKGSVENAESLLHDVRDLYEKDDEYAQDIARVGPLLEAWARTFGLSDLVGWKVLDVEREFKVPLSSSGVFMTIRPDTLLEREGEVRVMETKTSGFSVQSAIWGVQTGGQRHAYTMGTKLAYPKAKRVVMIPDVAFWRKGNLEPRNIICERGTPLSSTPSELTVFAEEVEATIRDVSERTATLFARGGSKPHTLFPRVREPGICTAYNRPCEYWEACAMNPTPGDRVFGYSWDSEKVKTYKKEITRR